MNKLTIVIHGGAGTIVKEDMDDQLEAAYKRGIEDAIDRGYEILEKGGTAVEAVKGAVMCLEDNILFNAGRGAVFTKKGVHEMDAAIMNGKTLEAGAVAGVKNVKNPVDLAQQVMLHSGHVLLAGEGATEFALNQHIQLEPDEYFYADFRYDQWREIMNSDLYQLDHKRDQPKGLMKDKKFGTVGAVALDKDGNIAAATSTGGMTNKKFGRIGDSPLIGIGTYANNNTCAVSCTGHGEIFMKAVAAYDVSCLMEYKGYTLQQACEEVVLRKLVNMHGDGGLIAIDKNGAVAMVFNSEGMYRGMRNADGEKIVAIYKDHLK